MRRAAAGYFALQGVSGLAWWALLFFHPDARGWFFPDAQGDLIRRSLAVPDISLFALGSLGAAACCWSNRMATIASTLIAGAVWYATLLAFGFSFASGVGWLGAVAMLGSALACSFAATLASGNRSILKMFRVTKQASTRGLALSTLMQTAVFWGVLLLVLPVLLMWLERQAGIPTIPQSAPLIVADAALFAMGALLGVTSAVYMVRHGRGTPLPAAAAPVMVTSGPYRFIRNPMAVVGLGQGMAVALWFGSPTILAYVLLGALIWHMVIRPLEEHDLALRFGASFVAYRRTTRCWVPRFTSIVS
ncbi:MAG: methyltransferase family protein [Phycisphaerales bacterium JB050]